METLEEWFGVTVPEADTPPDGWLHTGDPDEVTRLARLEERAWEAGYRIHPRCCRSSSCHCVAPVARRFRMVGA